MHNKGAASATFTGDWCREDHAGVHLDTELVNQSMLPSPLLRHFPCVPGATTRVAFYPLPLPIP